MHNSQLISAALMFLVLIKLITGLILQLGGLLIAGQTEQTLGDQLCNGLQENKSCDGT
jgi:hypothetical protein